jgi:hypothetical protein
VPHGTNQLQAFGTRLGALMQATAGQLELATVTQQAPSAKRTVSRAYEQTNDRIKSTLASESSYEFDRATSASANSTAGGKCGLETASGGQNQIS